MWVQVQKGLAFSKVFRTLRDMSKENTVDPKRLSKIREVGTGAFATGQVFITWIVCNCRVAEFQRRRCSLAPF